MQKPWLLSSVAMGCEISIHLFCYHQKHWLEHPLWPCCKIDFSQILDIAPCTSSTSCMEIKHCKFSYHSGTIYQVKTFVLKVQFQILWRRQIIYTQNTALYSLTLLRKTLNKPFYIDIAKKVHNQALLTIPTDRQNFFYSLTMPTKMKKKQGFFAHKKVYPGFIH